MCVLIVWQAKFLVAWIVMTCLIDLLAVFDRISPNLQECLFASCSRILMFNHLPKAHQEISLGQTAPERQSLLGHFFVASFVSKSRVGFDALPPKLAVGAC